MLETIDDLILIATERRASDIHLTVGLPPMLRVDGELVRIREGVLNGEEVRKLAYSIMNERQIKAFEEKGELDFAFSVPGKGRFRLNVFKQRGSVALAGRLLNSEIPSPEFLGLPPAVIKMCEKKRGLVLVTGPTGSGKSTTLASLINVINENKNYHIMTLEDPIEYLHRHKKSIVNQREMGNDSENYASALRAALREDPDVILVGEMRDLETISTAITAAETGHLVFSTLHTIGAANTIDRIIDVFPPYQQQQVRTQLADVLECVVSQQLVPAEGDRGRYAAIEVMLSNSAIRAHIRESKTYQIPSVMQMSKKEGMITMDDALLKLFQERKITWERALAYAQDPTAVKKRFIM